MAGFSLKENQLEEVRLLGVKDSKLLKPKEREELYKKLVKYEHFVIIVQASEIDEAISSPDHMNLNWLEATKTAEIINKLEADKAIADCPSTNMTAYRDYIKKKLLKEVEVIAEHKADMNYPIVSAASIIAKVIRDREIEKIKEKIGHDFGSGYPSDPKTQKFLAENWDKYNIFRKTWSTWKNQKTKKTQKGLMDF